LSSSLELTNHFYLENAITFVASLAKRGAWRLNAARDYGIERGVRRLLKKRELLWRKEDMFSAGAYFAEI
jgi:hypothetical protein